MTGTLEHLGGDKWKIRMYAGTDQAGKQRLRSKTFRAATPQKARKQADTIRAELTKSIRDGVARRDTIAGLADEWLRLKTDRGKSPSTIVNYRRHAKRIVERFGKMKVVDLTGRHVDAWYADLSAEGMSKANILHHHATLRGMLRQAEKWEMVGRVATRNATPPERIAAPIRLPTSAAVEVMLRSASGDLALALHVLAATGARRGEVVGLQWDDINGDVLTIRRSILTQPKGTWLVKSTKGKRERPVELDPYTMALLEQHRATVAARCQALRVQTPWVLPDFRTDSSGRTPRKPGWLSGEWGKLRKRHGVTCRLSDLRHWHLSVLIRSGVPIPEVSRRAGHAQLSTTLNIYSHVMPGEKGRAAAAIGSEMSRDHQPEQNG